MSELYGTLIEKDVIVGELSLGVEYYKGQDGKDGKDGQDGYTPIKGVDYFDGKDGRDGIDGKDYILTEEDKNEIAELIEGDIFSDYATIDYVDNAIANIDIPEVDLSGYATIEYVNEAIAAIPEPDLTPYQTAEQVETAINNALSSIGVAEEGEY